MYGAVLIYLFSVQYQVDGLLQCFMCEVSEMDGKKVNHLRVDMLAECKSPEDDLEFWFVVLALIVLVLIIPIILLYKINNARYDSSRSISFLIVNMLTIHIPGIGQKV